MAVAAYAAVLSLIDVLDRIQHPSRHRLHLDRKQTEALRDKVSFLQEFLELYCSQRISKEMEGLAWQISNFANVAEDIVDSHVVNQIRKGFPDHGEALALFCRDIERVMEKVDSIKGKLMMVKERMTVQEQQPRVSTASPSISSGKNTMVGFDEHLVRIRDELTGYRSDPQILPIIGMGGIGKTTLTRNVFDDSLIANHFDVRYWVTISQEYKADRILLDLLQDMGVGQEDRNVGEDLAKLGEKLYKSLWGRRYLIVTGDVWSLGIWNDIKSFFPDNKNECRIMVTTRLSNVAISLGSHTPYWMDFLDEDQSWNLFCEKTFTEGCPPELEEIGKKIARSCRGLPLAIVLIGGLLSNSNMTQEYWEFVAKNMTSFANSGNDEHCLKILSLSYNHLPVHLKPCFLYMRVFPEDKVIKISKLTKQWVAEGFLKPIRGKTLEEAAEEYLKDLINRNLILRQTRYGTYGKKIKTCSIHDLFRDLCIRESQREHFYHVPKVQCMEFLIDFKKCFLCGDMYSSTKSKIHLPEIHVISQPTSLASCFVCDVCEIMHPQLDRSRLVRAVDTCDVKGYLHPTKLRYLDISADKFQFKFVSTLLPLLWNLQTLILSNYSRSRIVLPYEILGMPQLRHLVLEGSVLIDLADREGSTTVLENLDGEGSTTVLENFDGEGSTTVLENFDGEGSTTVLENLQTLSTITNFRCSEEVLERIPNLKKLGIKYDKDCMKDMECSYYRSLHNLIHLHKLESFSLSTFCPFALRGMAFPHMLKKLSLMQCRIPWEEMTIIGSLPNLEVLKLKHRAFVGSEWNPVEGEFPRLKLLSIWRTNLKYWRAEKIHFPSLESLELGWMEDLANIPSEIGEIETLRFIRLVFFCHESVINSAKEILEEQQSLGNEILQLEVSRW